MNSTAVPGNSTSLIPPLDPAAVAALVAEVVQLEKDILVVKYITAASVALLIYDILLTFPTEHSLIWKSRFSRGSMLYLAVRYMNLISMALNLMYYVWLDPPFEFCKVYFFIDAWFSIACVIPITIVQTFRTYAVCDRDLWTKRILWAVVVITNSGLIACVIVTTVQAKFLAPSLPGFTCVLSSAGFSRAASIVQYSSSVVFEFSIFFITIRRLYKLYVFGKTNLIKVIMRDCLWYFMALCWLDLAGLLLFIGLPSSRVALAAAIANPSRSLAVILTSRIVLNLRGFVCRDDAEVTINTLTTPPGVYVSSYSLTSTRAKASGSAIAFKPVTQFSTVDYHEDA